MRDKIITAIEADKSEMAHTEDVENDKVSVENAVTGLSMDNMT